MKRLLILGSLAVLLTACGSNVKLDEPPVEDRAGNVVVSGPGSGETAASGQSGVAQVNLGGQGAAAPGPVAGNIVYFDFDSYVVKPEAQPVLEAHARYIKADRRRQAVIEGHTDERGGREYNLALGQRRSEAVRRSLVLLGVPDAQIEAVSFGKEKPAAPGNDEGAMAQNRRAEIKYR